MWKPGGRRFFYEGSVLAGGLTVFLACSPRGQPLSVLGYKVRGDMSLLGAVGRVQRFAGASTGPTRPANCGFLTTKGRVGIPGVWARRGVQCCGKPTRHVLVSRYPRYPGTPSKGGCSLSVSLRAYKPRTKREAGRASAVTEVAQLAQQEGVRGFGLAPAGAKGTVGTGLHVPRPPAQ